MSNPRNRAAIVYLVRAAVHAFWLGTALTLAAVYAIRDANLDAFELVLLGTILEGSVLLFEVPTGVVADLFGRKRSVVISSLLYGLSFILWGAVPTFPAIAVAQAGWGIGYTFSSGALQAWLSDEVGESAANRLFLRGSQLAAAGALAGTVAAVALGSMSLGLPLVVAGFGLLAEAVALAVAMPETGAPHRLARERGDRPIAPHRAAIRTLRQAVGLVRGRPIVVSILAIAVFHGAASEALDRLWELHFLEGFRFPDLGGLDPVAWFGVMNVGSMGIALVATEIVRRRVDTDSHAEVSRLLSILQVVLVGSVVAFGLAGEFAFALGSIWTYYLARDLVGPLSDAWLNQSLEPATRATVFSFAGQADAIGQIAGGPLVGALAAMQGTRWAIVASAIILAPGLWLYARARRQAGGDGAVEPAAVPDSGDAA